MGMSFAIHFDMVDLRYEMIIYNEFQYNAPSYMNPSWNTNQFELSKIIIRYKILHLDI